MTEPVPLDTNRGNYPECYEEDVFLQGVGAMKVRPIESQDAHMLEALFAILSPQSIYFRFFTYLKQLTPAMLKRFTQIDYDTEIALIAIHNDGTGKKMLGVARIIRLEDERSAEFSVLVGDPWQGKGIGARLLKHCIAIARRRGIRQIAGMVMAGNTHMLALGRKLNCKRQRLPGSSDYMLTLDLSDAPSAEAV